MFAQVLGLMLSYAKEFPLLNASSMTIEDAIEDGWRTNICFIFI
jgi:hypothetical protein